jgi:hypothetical protein
VPGSCSNPAGASISSSRWRWIGTTRTSPSASRAPTAGAAIPDGSLPLSVAQHSLTVLALRERADGPLSATEASCELLHDADEGFLGFDPIAPLKPHLGPHDQNVVEHRSARSRCATACCPGNPMSMPRTSTPTGSRQRAKRSSSRTMSATPKHEAPREAERNSTKRAKPVPLAHPALQGSVALPRSRAGARPCPAGREGAAVHGVEKKTTGGSDP